MIQLHHGDCLDVLPTLDGVDAIVTDPPYGLSFMGKGWDHGVPGVPYWQACSRVLRPGGYLLAFGGTRTHHRLTCAIEDAGFEIRDCLMWLFGSGFPKGRGCLKPAWEPIILARRPGKRVLPLGIEECKVEAAGPDVNARKDKGSGMGYRGDDADRGAWDSTEGRWPPNLLLSHHPDCNGTCHADCVVLALGEQSGERTSRWGKPSEMAQNHHVLGLKRSNPRAADFIGDTGTAARFYPQFRYEPKASRRDRNEGCEGLEERPSAKMGDGLKSMVGHPSGDHGNTSTEDRRSANHHPCVKPTAIMEWLVRLACPEGGTVLDPFMGSGSTGKACVRAGRGFIGIERDAEWLPIAQARIEYERAKRPLFAAEVS